MMNRIVLAITGLTASMLLTGCNTVTLLWKPGVSVNQKQYDYDECTIAAFRQVPINQVTNYTPGFYDPGTTQCSRVGNDVSCYRVGEVNIQGSISSYDKNQALRERVRDRCLAAKGYQKKEVPVCTSTLQKAEADKAKSIDQVKCWVKELK
ncbi:hypothetical protein ACI0FR_00829 [Paenochrobactrum sp. BZR 201-1]